MRLKRGETMNYSLTISLILLFQLVISCYLLSLEYLSDLIFVNLVDSGERDIFNGLFVIHLLLFHLHLYPLYGIFHSIGNIIDSIFQVKWFMNHSLCGRNH